MREISRICKTEGAQLKQADAVSYCNNLVAEGKADWYLPSSRTLSDIYSVRTALEAISGFEPFVRYYYISTTPGGLYGWYIVSMANGTVGSDTATGLNYVRCIRPRQ